MAIVVNSIGVPQNVQASLQSGGSLDASTTYYIRVYACNQNRGNSAINNTQLLSRLSTEINFTTDSVNRSAMITWDVVSGALTYMVLMTKTSGDYADRGYLDGHGLRGYNNYASTQTNSFLISIDTTVDGDDFIDNACSGCHPCQIYTNGYNLLYGYYPGNLLGVDLSLINITISGDEGTTTLDEIAGVLDAAGYSDHYFWDRCGVFTFWGYIVIEAGAIGNFRGWSNQTSTGFLNLYMWLAGAIQNNSSDFDVIFGSYSAVEGDKITNVTIYSPQSYYTDFANIKAYNTIIQPGIGSLPSLLTYGVQLYNLDDCVDCQFWSCRYSNFTSDMNNNSFQGNSTYRWWGSDFVENITFDPNVGISIYPRNSTITPRDCLVKTHVVGTTASFTINGYGGEDLSAGIINVYDTLITGTKTSWKDVIFSWGQAGGVLPPFRVHFSYSLEVCDLNGNPINGATVILQDQFGNTAFSDTTVNGQLSKKDVLYYQFECNGNDGSGPDYTTTYDYRPFVLTITKYGYQAYKESGITGEEKIEKVISLQPNPVYLEQDIQASMEEDEIYAKV